MRERRALSARLAHVLLAPDENAARHVIEHSARDRTGKTSDPPILTTVKNKSGQTDIGDYANRAACRKKQESGNKSQAADATVSIGELIIQ